MIEQASNYAILLNLGYVFFPQFLSQFQLPYVFCKSLLFQNFHEKWAKNCFHKSMFQVIKNWVLDAFPSDSGISFLSCKVW